MQVCTFVYVYTQTTHHIRHIPPHTYTYHTHRAHYIPHALDAPHHMLHTHTHMPHITHTYHITYHNKHHTPHTHIPHMHNTRRSFSLPATMERAVSESGDLALKCLFYINQVFVDFAHTTWTYALCLPQVYLSVLNLQIFFPLYLLAEFLLVLQDSADMSPLLESLPRTPFSVCCPRGL